MCADTITQTRDSQRKLSNVRLAEDVRGTIINYIRNGRRKGICWRVCWYMRSCVQCTDLYNISRKGEASGGGGANLNKTGGWGGVTQRSPKYATAHMYACVRNVFVFVSTYHCAFINACVCASVRACPKMCEFVCAYVYSA